MTADNAHDHDHDHDHPDREFSTELHLDAPRDTVWQAIASDRGLRRWFAPDASFDPKVGGEVVWNWTGHHRWVQRIEILEPGARLRTRYDSAVDDGAGGKRPLFIDFLLEGDGGSTTLRVVQSGFGPEADFDAEYDGISRGWPVELQSLRLYVERHAGKDRGLAWAAASIDTPADLAWQQLTGEQGFRCGTLVDAHAMGTPFRFESADGEVFAGTALHCHPREFSGIASSHGDAFLRISCEPCADQTQPWCWLAAWDRPADELAALQSRWHSMLSQLFPTTSATSAGERS